jgi:hypothetical protein
MAYSIFPTGRREGGTERPERAEEDNWKAGIDIV